MHPYRTHDCGTLRLEDVGREVRLSGWVDRKRDHGNLLFIDLRDHAGVTQCVLDATGPHFATAEAVRLESVITVTGPVVARTADTVNPALPTGTIEIQVAALTVTSAADPLPLQVNSEVDYPGAGVLVAEARRDLEIAVEPGDHQELLELLRRLGQGVEAARMQAAGHQEVAGALGRGGGQDRRLEFVEAGLGHPPSSSS